MIDRVYIAAPYPMKSEAVELRDELQRHGVFCTSRWLNESKLNTPRPTDAEVAAADLADVNSAQALVLLHPECWANAGTGGCHVETGAALILGMPVFVLGIKSNVFHTLFQVREVDTCLNLARLLHDCEWRSNSTLSSSFLLSQLIDRVHTANRRWWIDLNTGAPLNRNVGELLMLVVSELAEAMEGHRKNLMDDKLTHRPMFTVEIADALIRLFDIVGGMGLDVPQAFEEKMVFNASREDHTAEHRKSLHGKKY